LASGDGVLSAVNMTYIMVNKQGEIIEKKIMMMIQISFFNEKN
jgi:hypothetical protein